MTDPIDYRSPPTRSGITPRSTAGRAIAVGAAILASGVVLVCLPFLLGEFKWNKYFVAFGIVTALLGISVIAHGAWDWIRSK